MSKITYDDKVALNINPNIADINKVNASDMNEIKTVVNNNDDILTAIGTTVNLFGDVCSAESDTGTVAAYSHITATKINATDWKFDIEGQLDISNAQHNYYWGIRLNRISTMLNNAIGIKVGYHTDLVKLGHWEIINPTTKLTYADKYGYGTTFGYEMSRYYTFCRYYTTAGAVGSWALDNFATGSILRATIYLREIA